MRVVPVLVALAILPSAVSAQEGRGVGYPTVAAALEALRARGDVSISVQGGWTIVDDRAAGTIWSFTPSSHPAHPAVVKRTVVSREDGIGLEMTALCQASKAACDKLIAEFKELNERMSQSIRDKTKSAQKLPDSEIQVQRLSDDSFRLVLKSFRSRSVDAGQEELLPKAKEACAGKSVAYGKYEFETLEVISPATAERKPLLLKQDISCGDAVSPRSPTVSTGNRDPLWRPTTAQVQIVERQTYGYFAAKDAGKYQEAYSLLSPSQKQTLPYERWTALAEKFNSEAGRVRNRKIKKVTWYKDPPRAELGVYAAADFSSQFANVDIHCGYVVWHEQANGSFLLVREEQNSINKDVQQKLKPEELEKVRSQFGC